MLNVNRHITLYFYGIRSFGGKSPLVMSDQLGLARRGSSPRGRTPHAHAHGGPARAQSQSAVAGVWIRMGPLKPYSLYHTQHGCSRQRRHFLPFPPPRFLPFASRLRRSSSSACSRSFSRILSSASRMLSLIAEASFLKGGSGGGLRKAQCTFSPLAALSRSSGALRCGILVC